MLARSLQHEVPHRSRVKGADYFARGAVLKVVSAPGGVAAVVRGSADYGVSIEREGDGLRAACECPFFADRQEICKHIWAVLLAPDTETLLAAHGGIPRRPWLIPAAGLGGQLAAARLQTPERWRHALGEIARLTRAASPRPDVPPRAGELAYLLDVPATLAGTGVVLRIASRHRKRDGTWTRPKPPEIRLHDPVDLPDPGDREVLALLKGADRPWAIGAYSHDAGFVYMLGEPQQRRLLPLICATGRLLVAPGGPGGELLPMVADGPGEWGFELTVTPAESGYALGGQFVRGAERVRLDELVLALRGGFLFSRTTMFQAAVGAHWAWVHQLQRSPGLVVPPDGIDLLREVVAQTAVDPASLPEALRYTPVRIEPRPGVRIRRPAGHPRDDLDAEVQFEYDGIVLHADGAPFFEPVSRRLVLRDVERERAAFERLAALGFRKVWSTAAGRQVLGVQADRFPDAVRALALDGWRVEAEGRLLRPPRDLQLEVRSGIDWFELHGRVDFGDGATASLPELLRAWRHGEGTIVLDDGSRGIVPEEWARRFAALADYGQPSADHLRYRTSQAALLDALLAAQPAVAVDDVFRTAREALASFDGVGALDPPPGFHGRLRDYQREALGWFEFLRRFGFGGCLADDMGLGKTVMVLALLEARRAGPPLDARPSLVVVPRSLVFNWIEEAKKFAPGLRLLDYTGAARSTAAAAEHDVVLTTYGTLRRDAAPLTGVEFDYVILDEAQAVKNAATASAKAVRLLRARHRLALSGTPIENHVGELWSLFDFLNPGLLGTAAAFARGTSARTRLERDDVAVLSRAVRPFILRRTKAQVAPELPERSEQTIHCELEPTQRRLYDELRDHYRRSLLVHVDRHGLGRSKLQVLEALLRLRQAACHPGLVDERRRDEAAVKFDVLLARLAELGEEGHKALVFSQFTSLLALLRPRLDAQGIAYEYLDGRTRDRAARVARFQHDPELRVFLISLKAGGLGLNLTGAEYVFLLDPWWNPAAEAQAIDRAHRIGQTRHVFAYRLIAQDTVEEKVAALQATKREIADAILTADAGLVRSLSREDLAWLVG